jgi:hypothetical protein
MVAVTASVVTMQDNTAELIRALEYLRDHEVFVGVPEKNLNRGEDETISNAQLLYIHTHGIRKFRMRRRMDEFMAKGAVYSKAFELYLKENGSPAWHAVPRPVLDPSVESEKFHITEQMGKAAAAAMDGNMEETRKRLQSAGIVAQEAAHRWMGKEHLAPNRPATIRMKGSDQPLVDTDSLRKAIIYVVRKKGSGREAIR